MAELHLLSPMGFRAAGVHAGIKTTQAPDVALLVCDGLASAAAAFTTSQVVSAAVTIGKKHIANGRLRAIVANSGNANACTGKQGEKDAYRMCQLAGGTTGCLPTQILPSSTGIIGHLLPMEPLERGIIEAGQYLGNSLEHAQLFTSAIMTTDLKRKTAAVEFSVGREKVVLAGACKGSGMIGPRLAVPHATMLAYLTTDAKIAPALLRKLLNSAVQKSFNCVTVDDHASTNDTCCILASGALDAKVESPKTVKAFAAALDEVCQSLAYQIAADGEGATKVVTITVEKARNDEDARQIARAIANSPLVKCAMNGSDPNWGRIVSAAGYAPAKFDPAKAVLKLQGTTVFSRGRPVAFNASDASLSLQKPEVKVLLTCNLGQGSATVWTCDLSKEYVSINADYHT